MVIPRRAAEAMITRAGVSVLSSTDVRELRVVPASPSQGAAPQPIDMFARRGTDHFVVPVHWARSRFETLEDSRSPGKPTRCEFAGDLRDEQRHVSALISTAFREHGGCVVSMATGSGKTIVALHAACEARVKTLVVVHKNFLVEQWTSRILQFVPNARVTHIRGSEFDLEGDFVIATIQTLLSRSYPPETFADFGLLIVDEAHVIAARAFSKVMLGLAFPVTLGLTATPDRRDGLGRVLNWFLGPTVYRRTAAKQGMDVRLKIVKYSTEAYDAPPPTTRRGDVCFTSMTSHLVADISRTRRIVDEIEWLFERDYDTLVLTHRRAHAVAIAALATSRGIPCATYLGGDKTVPSARVVVSTFALTAEGFDEARFRGLILSTPASNVTQAVGRVMRSPSGRSIVVDIVDTWSVFFALAAKRRAIYRNVGIVPL